MAGGSGGETIGATLEETPTWAVATVCFVLITVSLIIERVIHRLAKYLEKKRRKFLLEALSKIKSDLMLLGFISLLLTVFEKPISNICIPESVAESFLPCGSLEEHDEELEATKCKEKGKVSLMSRVGVQQLQMLIFFLASFNVLSSFITFTLGTAKMKRWELWEAETRTLEYQYSNDPRRFQFVNRTTFGRRHLKFWSDHRFLRFPVSFLRMFFGSVYKVDYFTLRHGFIAAHFTEGSRFDFQKYIKRGLDKDFKVVVGMRLWIWICSVLFIFFNAHVFHNYAWLPFIPLLMLLVVGTKLQGIITRMCLDTEDRNPNVVRGHLLVRPSDRFFWLGRPKLLLHLMHFILFQNSFQLAFFSWSWYKFGLRSCFHRETEDIVIRLVMGILIPILSGYVTLPLYALVTQMGTSMSNSVFPEGVVGGLKRWRAKARRNLARRDKKQQQHPSTNYSINSLSVDSSIDLDAANSLSLDDDDASEDGAAEIKAAENDGNHHLNLGSFRGFHVGNV